MVVANTLYLNAPFINTLKEKGLEGDDTPERRKKIEVWNLSGFEMEGCRYKLRVVRYHEQWEEKGEKAERFMWLVTTLETAGYRVLCKMMNRRWNADNWIIYKNA